jgi:hypothetical protein
MSDTTGAPRRPDRTSGARGGRWSVRSCRPTERRSRLLGHRVAPPVRRCLPTSSASPSGQARDPRGTCPCIRRAPGRSLGATRRQTLIADGEQPAVSDDGTQLAYGAAIHGLAVRDLATGTTRTIGLVAQLGKAADLLDASLPWLADGTDIAIIPSPPAWDLVGRRPPPARWCNTIDIRSAVSTDQLLYAVARLCRPIGEPDIDQSQRMVAILVDGLRYDAGAPSG